MLIIRVGDPHVKINNLDESAKLMEFVIKMIYEFKPDRVELLGDLFHNHAVVRVEVLEFWDRFLTVLSDICETVVLVGNHDQTGNYESGQHALGTLMRINPGKLHIIDSPTHMGVFAYMPYVHHQEPFLESANKLFDEGAKVLVCHATFEGSKYDNGMYAPDGFDPDKLKFSMVISGHIHARQRFGKVIYPGTAKWDTNSDANEEKGIWLVEHTEDGSIINETFLDTSKVVTPIYSIEWKEGDVQPEIPAGRVTVELIGTSEWVKKQKEKLKGKCGLKSKITDTVKERRKVGKGLLDFVNNNFTPINGVERTQLVEYMKETNLVESN